MSRYDELTQLYRKTRFTFQQYEDDCAAFARELVNGLLEYMEWPRNQEITFLAIDEEVDPSNKFYALSSAMQLDRQSFWHFGLEVKMEESGGAYPLSLVLSFFIKKTDSDFIVKLGPKGRELKIPESKRGQLEPFYEAVFVQMKEFFHKSYFQAITGNEQEFGFITLL